MNAVAGTVWLVEDSPLEAQLVCRTLMQTHQVEVFGEVEPMIERLLTSPPPDVLVLDWHLPGMSGLEACAFLRSRLDEVALPILILTADGTGQGGGSVVEGLTAGANDYLRKPYEPPELLARVNTLVRIRHLARTAEQARREADVQRSYFEASFRHAKLGIALVGLDGCVVESNAAYELILGCAASGLAGRSFGSLMNGEDQRRAEAAIQQVLSGEVASLELETRCQTAAGAWVTTLNSLALARDGEGAPVSVVVLTQDITEAKGEQALRLVRQDFEKQLIGIVSHDLRTPLTAILISANLLQRWTVDDRVSRGLDRVRRAAERAERMVRDLLDFTQARLGGGLALQRTELDLHAHSATVLEELRLANPGRVLTLATSADAQGLWDGDRLAQLLTNLVSNALRYGDPTAPVAVELTQAGDAITLTVHNTGKPIPPEQLERIFEPMQRGPADADTNGRSVGLGLYIVRAITSAHRGSIQVRSNHAEGTRFMVELPRERRA